METKVVRVNDTDIKVLQYLPMKDKNDYIYITIQQCEQNNIFNLIKFEVFSNINIIKMYTDLTQPIDMNEYEWYDELFNNGILEAVINAIPEEELDYLTKTLKDTMDMKLKYGNNFGAVLSKFIDELPKNAKEAQDIVNQFNPEEFQNVMNFAKAANGGREFI